MKVNNIKPEMPGTPPTPRGFPADAGSCVAGCRHAGGVKYGVWGMFLGRFCSRPEGVFKAKQVSGAFS